MPIDYLRRRAQSFGYAFKGLAHLFRTQPHARIHLFVLIVVVALGLLSKLERWEWASVILVSALVLSLEAANTALESLTDLVSPEHHRLAGIAKDCAAAAVLIAAFGAVAVGGIVFLPRLAEVITIISK